MRFYQDYASEKKLYYMVLWLSVSFMLPQRRKRIREIGWEVRFGQHFRRYREFTSLNFRMLLLFYHYVIVYAVFTRIMLWQRNLQRSCVTLILCFYVYSWYEFVMVHSIYYAYMRKTFSSYCYTFTRTHIFKGLVTLLNFRNHTNMIF